uniref:C2 domain containing protein, putative n=1 Tax=Theileria annulata TaxID=5874 RepID=A0A3B0NHK8_THEAN
MEFSKGKEFFAKKFEFLQKTGLKGIDKVLGEQSNLLPNATATATNVVNTSQNAVNAAGGVTNEAETKVPDAGANVNETENAQAEGTSGQTAEGSEIKENFDDDLLWSNNYTYDTFIDSLNIQYDERGSNAQEKRHWSYPRRWSVKLFNLKIVNLLPESLSCFAEFDFGGTRDECRVQIGSSNYILSRGKSKNYIRTPVLKDIEKDQSRSFQCSHSFEYRGSYLDLENEKLRIKLWSCKKYTVNSLVSIYDQFLIKFAEGDEHIEIPMYKYIDNQKKITCNLSFNLFFQELYDFEINLINFKINNAISTYFLFNYLQLHLSKLNDGPVNNDSTPTNKESSNKYVNEWNLLDKMRYSIFRTKMERKMKKIKASKKKEKEKEQQQEEDSGSDFDEDDEFEAEENQDSEGNTTKVDVPSNDTQTSQKAQKKKKKKKKSKAGVGFKSAEDDKEKKDKDTTLTFQSDNNEYISILRDNIKFFVQVGKYVPFVCEIEPWPRVFIRLKTDSMHLKNMSLLSHSVKNAFSCEWDNLGEIVFRGTLNELCNSHLEIKLMDWSAPKAANCIGVAIIPMESIVDYPYISSRLYPPEWLKLKSQYEGWNDKLEDLHLGTVTGTMIVNRKPRYRQLRGTNRTSSSSHLLIVHINSIDQLLANTQESVDSYVEVTFNNVTLRTNLCKDMLGPKYNEEIYIPIPTVTTYEELLEMGSIKITVWGYIMEKLNYFGSCEITVNEIHYNKNTLRPLTKKMHNLMDSFKYEVTYETIVYTTSKRLYHYQYNEQDSISNISFSAWFYPLIVPNRTSDINKIRNTVNPNLKQGNNGFSDCEKLIEIWRNICMITNNEYFGDYYYFYDQFGNKMFPSSFVQPIHSPPTVDSVNHMFHFVNSIPFVNKRLQNVFTIDFLLKLKSGSIIDHCILFLSFLINYNPNFEVYTAIGQQKDKKFNAFLVQFIQSDTSNMDEKVVESVNAQNKNIREMIIYDFNAKHSRRISMNSEMKREVKKLNFQTINILFNDRNLWLNVQNRKDISSLDYDINNINNWYPFVPYNPTMHITKDYYHKIIGKINSHITSNVCGRPDKGENIVYYINWHRKNEYVVNMIENRMLEELKRYISMYRSAQNLVTNFNACHKLQKFLKRYIKMVHDRDTNNEDNLEIIKSQIREWRSQLENKIPRGYRILIRTVRFNTIDSGNMFDVIKHKLDFLDSRESTSIFVVALKIFEMCSNLFSTYFLIMHANKIDETLRNIILLQTNVEDKVRSRSPEHSEENSKNKTLEELTFESNVADVLYDPEGTGKADEDRLQRIRSLKTRTKTFNRSKSRFNTFKSTSQLSSGPSKSLVLSDHVSSDYMTDMPSQESEFYENLNDEEVLKMDSYDFTTEKEKRSKYRPEYSSSYTFSTMKSYTTNSLREVLSGGTLVSDMLTNTLGSGLETNILSSSTYSDGLNRTLTSSTILKKILTDSNITSDFENQMTSNDANLYLKKILTNSSISSESKVDKQRIKDTKSDGTSDVFSTLSNTDDTFSSSSTDRRIVVNKKLPLNSKIIKNKGSSNLLSELDKFSNLDTLKLGSSNLDINVQNSVNIFPSPSNQISSFAKTRSIKTKSSETRSIKTKSSETESSSLFTSDIYSSEYTSEKTASESIDRTESRRSQSLISSQRSRTPSSLTKTLSSSSRPTDPASKVSDTTSSKSLTKSVQSSRIGDSRKLTDKLSTRSLINSIESKRISESSGIDDESIFEVDSKSKVNRAESYSSSGSNINSIIRSSNSPSDDSVLEEPTRRKSTLRIESISSISSIITRSSFTTTSNNMDNFRIIKNSSDNIDQTKGIKQKLISSIVETDKSEPIETINDDSDVISNFSDTVRESSNDLSASDQGSRNRDDTSSSSIHTIRANEESLSDFSTTSSGTTVISTSSTLTSKYTISATGSSKYTNNMTNSQTFSYKTKSSNLQLEDSTIQLDSSSKELDESSKELDSWSKEESEITRSNEYTESWSSLNDNSEDSSYRRYRRVNPYSSFMS